MYSLSKKTSTFYLFLIWLDTCHRSSYENYRNCILIPFILDGWWWLTVCREMHFSSFFSKCLCCEKLVFSFHKLQFRSFWFHKEDVDHVCWMHTLILIFWFVCAEVILYEIHGGTYWISHCFYGKFANPFSSFLTFWINS